MVNRSDALGKIAIDDYYTVIRHRDRSIKIKFKLKMLIKIFQKFRYDFIEKQFKSQNSFNEVKISKRNIECERLV